MRVITCEDSTSLQCPSHRHRIRQVSPVSRSKHRKQDASRRLRAASSAPECQNGDVGWRSHKAANTFFSVGPLLFPTVRAREQIVADTSTTYLLSSVARHSSAHPFVTSLLLPFPFAASIHSLSRSNNTFSPDNQEHRVRRRRLCDDLARHTDTHSPLSWFTGG